MTNSLYRPISKGVAGTKIPLASDVAQFVDLFNANVDVGVLNLAGQIATLSTGGLSLALASGGTLGIGAYIYKFTFVTGVLQADGSTTINGESSGSASLSITTTSGNQKVTISGLPAVGTWPITAIGIRIYRTSVGGADGTQKLVTTLYTNYLRTTFVTSYLDAIADGSLTTAVPTTNTTGTTFAPLTAHEADYTLQVPYGGVTTGTANTYALAAPTITALTVGMAVSVKLNVDSTGASTLNWNGKGAKGIKKANGNDVTNLHATGIYTLRYDGTNFILQGEGGSGNATASDLLSGKTASTDAGDIVGTMPDKGATSFSPSTVSQAIPLGKYNGSGVVNPVTGTAGVGDVLSGKTFASGNGIGITGTIPNNSGAYQGPVTSNGAFQPNRVYLNIPYGFYDGVSSTSYNYATDANFIPANIPNGMSMFGLVGTGANAKRKATGTLTVASGKEVVTGLAFTPGTIVLEWLSGSTYFIKTYNTGNGYNGTDAQAILFLASVASASANSTTHMVWTISAGGFSADSQFVNGTTVKWTAYEG